MPLPFIIGGIVAAAGVAGLGSGVHGGIKLKEANDTMKQAESIQNQAVKKFKCRNMECTWIMDSLGKKELEILSSFDEFSNYIEKIQDRPEFKQYTKDGICLPKYEAEELKKVSAGAGILLGGLGGTAVGTAGGFAAAGATTSAVMALGTASTGTAISTLSGVAATNATLAALGGGSIAAGGGGIALGTAILGSATLGIGLLVGGIIFNATGTKLSEKADEAYRQASRTRNEVEKVCEHLNKLKKVATSYLEMLGKVDLQYRKRLGILDNIVNFSEKTKWNDLTEKEKKLIENLVLLVGLLNEMCKVNLVKKNGDVNELNDVNKEESDRVCNQAQHVLSELESVA